ncbi:RNA polymerase recycling motor HelD [Bacillus alkalicellulosilyticus]|uniref:RNA polymerase recycling motor HelD n=1 Tax=Alkalihalobacterium alkalicellulosilyticum TaxID=1912214 RepID=UPI000996C982|nr:RNA polymerase recycling motor HelD [Bacillus alkalicellulosilyticus]
MSQHPTNVENEQKRVDMVVAKINDRLADLLIQLGTVKGDVFDIRKKFWDDVTVNLDNAEEVSETFASIKQQAELLNERERSHHHANKQFKSLERLKHSPYFGRIDFQEDNEETEPIYIGTASFVDKNGVDFYVYDWRAPISSMYYDFGPGPAHYETPYEQISGQVKLKKQYIIRQGQLLHMFDTGVTIGDELLQEVLGKQADSQMKSIVATIQQEQNVIIRNEKSRILLVQGVAGSGKTSAALQRVAYLLYRYRDTIEAENIVLFSPNSMFNSYVRSVLPELGEENMQQTTFQEYVHHRLASEFTIEDPFTQMEYILSETKNPAYQTRIQSIQFKSSFTFMKMVDGYVEGLKKEGVFFHSLEHRGKEIISGKTIHSWFYETDQHLSLPNRLNFVIEQLLKAVREIELEERKKEWVDKEIELLDNEILLKAHQKVQNEKKQHTVFMEFDREHEILAAYVVKRSLKSIRNQIKQMEFVDFQTIYSELFSPANAKTSTLDDEQWKQIGNYTKEQLHAGFLPYEDVTPYLYVKEQIGGFQVNTMIRHVFIDEAQDYSPFQFAFIVKLFPRAKMTILGDGNQSIFTHSTTDSFSSLLSLFSKEQVESYQLTKSYRSTKQIVEFTKQMINADIIPFNRNGHKPMLIQARDCKDLNRKVVHRIKELQKEGQETIAVICKTEVECEQAYEHLQEQIDVTKVTKHSGGYESGTLIIPSYLAKGVEFDAVIIYNASAQAYHLESERKLFYTACTRAMHSLTLFYKNEVTPYLKEISEDTFDEYTNEK